jgi:hypothetical protein
MDAIVGLPCSEGELNRDHISAHFRFGFHQYLCPSGFAIPLMRRQAVELNYEHCPLHSLARRGDVARLF